MQLHFYTSFESIEALRNGMTVYVWNKSLAKPHHIHISVDVDKYIIEKSPIHKDYTVFCITRIG